MGNEPWAGTSFRMSETDADFLDWVADRLVHRHRERPSSDYVLKLRELAVEVRQLLGGERRIRELL